MSTWAVTMVKNEADVIEGTLRHMAGEVDGLIVADNMSTDGTRGLVLGLSKVLSIPLILAVDDEPGYYQSEKMTKLGQRAGREAGATWIVPFDADELWSHPDMRVADRLALLGRVVDWVPAHIFNHYETGLDSNPRNETDAFKRMNWGIPGDPKFHKVAYRYRSDIVVAQGNHGISSDRNRQLYRGPGHLDIDHYPYRSAEQFVRKARQGAAAYAATDLPEHMGEHWRSYGAMTHDEATAWYHEWFTYPDPEASGLVNHPAPYRRWEGAST